MTIKATDNILNVPVRKPYTATLNVTKNINGTATTTSTTLTETDDHEAVWSYAFPIYAKGSDGVYYKTDATTFGESGTFTDGETIDKTVEYNTADNDIVFFNEARGKRVQQHSQLQLLQRLRRPRKRPERPQPRYLCRHLRGWKIQFRCRIHRCSWSQLRSPPRIRRPYSIHSVYKER